MERRKIPPLEDHPSFRLDLHNLIDNFALNEFSNSDESKLFYRIELNKKLAQLSERATRKKGSISVIFGYSASDMCYQRYLKTIDLC